MAKKFDVGYRKPPRASQFKKGVSGNPKGRPKGSKDFMADLHEELAQRMPITERGKVRHVSKQRAYIMRIIADAFSGKMAAQRTLLSAIQKSPLEDLTPVVDNPLREEEEAILKRIFERMAGDADEDA